jgi:hypothetical protein
LRWIALALVIFYLLAVSIACATARGSSYPTSRAALAWRPPPGFIWQAWCIHRHESADWHRRWVDWRGAPSRYAGGMQFLQNTWDRAGGSGEPWQWSPREQIFRAFVIWRKGGGSWGEWGTRARCGLR